jgi:hypothetical protein
MTPEEAQEYTESLGQIFTGSYRQIAWAIQQGVPRALGLPVQEWGKRLEGRIKLGIEERQAAARELADEGFSQREIGTALGVDAATVNRDLQPVADATPEPDDLLEDEPPVADATTRGDATKLVTRGAVQRLRLAPNERGDSDENAQVTAVRARAGRPSGRPSSSYDPGPVQVRAPVRRATDDLRAN